MPSPLDLAFVILITVVITLFETFVFFPRFKAAVAAGAPNARLNAYRRGIFGQWAFTAMAIALWIRAGRPWVDLGLVPPGSSRLLLSVIMVTLMAALVAQQIRAIRRTSADGRQALRPKLAGVEFLLPHTEREYRWFKILSLTAGVCEEVLYRGFLMWALRSYVGLVGAIVVSTLLFGFGHAYQGVRGATKAGAAGLVLNLIVIATGWLIPAMVVHALIDASAGVLGFAVLGPPPSIAARA
jgi:membrane protease YdiL (CAAX protease family)